MNVELEAWIESTHLPLRREQPNLRLRHYSERQFISTHQEVKTIV
jgi:hypothetical protein